MTAADRHRQQAAELRKPIRIAFLRALVSSHPDSGALAQEAADEVLPVVAAALAAAEQAVHDRYQALADELEAEAAASLWHRDVLGDAAERLRAVAGQDGQTT